MAAKTGGPRMSLLLSQQVTEANKSADKHPYQNSLVFDAFGTFVASAVLDFFHW